MSKKVISILLSAAMLVAMFCVGFGAINASADDDENVTYYFLAPDNYFKTEAGAANSSVGFYYWNDGGNGDWPGQEATPAPEVHPNAFKINIHNNDYIGTIIFNAFVDAGEPADPELAAVAHQTVNINVEDDNYDGQIYVLNNDEKSVNEYSGAITTGGEWFTLDTFESSANYKTYGFGSADTDVSVETKTEPTPGGKTTYHKDDIVTVTYKIGNLDKAAAVNSIISYNSDILAIDTAFGDKDNDEEGFHVEYGKGSVEVNTEYGEGQIGVGATFAAKGVNDFKDAPVAVATIRFIATANFNAEDLGIDVTTTSLTNVVDGVTNTIVKNAEESDLAASYVSIVTEITCEHEPESDTDTASDADSDSDTASEEEADTDSSKSGTDSAKAGSTSSTTTTASTATTPTVQTAGTFAVISLVVILMAAAGVVIYTRKKTEE